MVDGGAHAGEPITLAEAADGASAEERRRSRRQGRREKQIVTPLSERCEYVLPRNERRCNIRKTAGTNFCGNHQPVREEAAPASEDTAPWVRRHGVARVPCPLDPAHSVYEMHLQKHLKVCNKRKDEIMREALPIFARGINSGPHRSEGRPSACPDTSSLLTFVRELYQGLREDLSLPVQELTSGPVAASVLSAISTAGLKHRSGRHVVQQASMVAHMAARGLLDKDTTCVEFGAGRGTLGHAIYRAFPEAKVILIERAGVRKKADAKHRRTGGTLHFERYRMDLRDVRLGGLQFSGRPLFVGKHVCGVATDLALRSVGVFVKEKPLARVGLCLATCCYNACAYQDYVGVEWWESVGLCEDDFKRMRRFSCWHSSSVHARRPCTDIVVSACHDQVASGDDDAVGGDEGEHMHHEQEETASAGGEQDDAGEVGRMCKRLIDYGRLWYLRSLGLRSHLVYYCMEAYTSENCCLVAWKEES